MTSPSFLGLSPNIFVTSPNILVTPPNILVTPQSIWVMSPNILHKKKMSPNIGCTMWVASPWGFSEMTIQPAWHESHACCLLRAGFLAFQPVVNDTRGTRVEQIVSYFYKILRGTQLTWYYQKRGDITNISGDMKKKVILAHGMRWVIYHVSYRIGVLYHRLCMYWERKKRRTDSSKNTLI